MGDCRPETWQVYLYATIAVLLVSGASFIGAFTIPFIRKERFKHVMIFFMALAVGTMAADALVHLVPHMILHGHSHEATCKPSTTVSKDATLPVVSLDAQSDPLQPLLTTLATSPTPTPLPKNQPKVTSDEDDHHGHSHGGSHGHDHGKRRRKRRQAGEDDHHGHSHADGGHAHGEEVEAEKFDDHTDDDHSGHAHDDHKSEEEEMAEYHASLWKLVVSVVTIYIFFLFESTARFYTFVIKKKATVQPAGATVNGVNGHMNGKTNGDVAFASPTVIQLNDVEKGVPGATRAGVVNTTGDIQTGHLASGDEYHMYAGHSHNHGFGSSDDDDSKKICGMKPVVFMIVFGGALHNFADGLALGASFSSSLSLGLSTAIALVCHEIPHELGDFATLLHTGLSVKMTLFLNGLSAVPAIIAVYIAIGLSTLSGVMPWIFAVVLGTFIYISLVAILNELREAEPERTLIGYVLCNAGMIIGAVILIIIAFYE